MSDEIHLTHTDMASDLDEYERYTVTVSPETIFHNPGWGAGNKKLRATDAAGETANIDLWADSAPAEAYTYDFEEGAPYTLSDLKFTTKTSGGKTHYNLTATEDTVVSRPDPEPGDQTTEESGDSSSASDDSPPHDTETTNEVSPLVNEADIDDAFSDVPDPVTTEDGHIITTFTSTTELGQVPVYEYELSASNGYRPEDEQAALKDTYRAMYTVYDQVEDPPIFAVSGPLQFISLGPLPTEALAIEDFDLSHTDTRRLNFKKTADRQTTKSLVDAALRRHLRGDYYVHGIDTVLTRSPIVSDEGFRLHERYNLSITISEEGRVYLSVDFRHKIRSDRTLDTLDNARIYPGLYVNVSYKDRGRGAWVDSLMDARATDPLPELGNQSLVDYHREAGQISDSRVQDIEEANRRVVRVTKMGSHRTEYYPQELLALQPHLRNLTQFAPQFNEDTRGKTRLSAQRCLNRSTQFIEDLGEVEFGTGALTFSPTPLSEDSTYEVTRLFDTEDDIVQFGGSTTGNHPSQITSASVYEQPPNFSVCLIHPNKGAIDERWQSLKRQLDRIDATPENIDKYEYDIDASADEIYGDLLVDIPEDHKYAASCVILPPESYTFGESGASEIYHEVKKALRQKHLDSQMVHFDTLTDDFALPNLALGLVAAAGGIPFTTEEAMPGDTDLFIGIDVTHRHPKDSDDRVHIAASTTSIYSDGTILGYTSARPQAGEKLPPGELKNIVRQAIVGYKQEVGSYPTHITLHRDGFMNEDLSAVHDLLDGFDITYDVVEIRKQSPARILNLSNGVAGVPDKGVATVNHNEGHAIVSTFGEPESLASSGNTGLPQPIQVEQKQGPTDIETLAAQVYLLSQSHIGASNATARLPITTYYADQASEAAAEGYLPPTSKLRRNIGFL